MLASLSLILSLLLSAAGSVNLVVVTLPARGGVTLPLAPGGKAEMRRDNTVTRIRIDIERVPPASTLGTALSTYVAWAVSPEGSFENIGEIAFDKDRGRLEATTRFEQVGVLITAEPHYMVDRPGDAIGFQTQAPKNDIRWVNVALEVGAYNYSALKLPSPAGVANIVVGARAAFQIAKAAEADRWAEAEFRRSRVATDTMEEMISRASSIEIVSQAANEVIRRSQQAVTAAREKKAAIALEDAKGEIALVKQESQSLNSRVQQLTQQLNQANSQIQRLQGDLAGVDRENQRVGQERDQLAARERTLSRELSELKNRQEQLQTRLVLPLRDEFFDLAANTLTPAGRDALARLSGMADAIAGQVRLEGPAPDVLFEAARQYLLQAGIPQDRIILKR